jgi:hypothetical protein
MQEMQLILEVFFKNPDDAAAKMKNFYKPFDINAVRNLKYDEVFINSYNSIYYTQNMIDAS